MMDEADATAPGTDIAADLTKMAAENERKRENEDSDAIGAKKRRKQLKPVRIAATHVPDSLPSQTVQVPKDDVVDRSDPATVPLIKSPRCPLKDVPFLNDIHFETPTTTNVPISDSGPSGPSLCNLSTLPMSFPYHQPWTDRNHKIFNQEAYCELCKKEFCNKYFLKTHKANKHGIYGNEQNGSTRQFVESNLSLSVPSMIDPPPQINEEEKKAFCDLCNKGFCNKYFVRRHKVKSHGFEDLDELNLVQKCSTKDATSSILNGLQDSEYFDDKEEPLNLVVNTESDTSSEDRPEDCTENLEKLQTMLLRLRPDAEPGPDEQTDESSEGETMNFKQDADPGSQVLIRKQSKPTSSYCEICNKELCNKYFMRTHMQRMHGIELEHGAQIGGVVCNICNKELCSKYFLRVHKQNTHGVPGPAGLPALRPDPKMPPRPGFTQVCMICSKRFRSTKWLQAHLQSDHGEPPPTGIPDAPVDVISKLLWEGSSGSGSFSCSQCDFTTPVLAFLFVHERSHVVEASDNVELVKPSLALQDLIHHKTFWQHAITQPAGLDLSARRTDNS